MLNDHEKCTPSADSEKKKMVLYLDEGKDTIIITIINYNIQYKVCQNYLRTYINNLRSPTVEAKIVSK